MTVVSLFGPGVARTTPRMGSDLGRSDSSRPSKRLDYNAPTPIGAGLTESIMMQSVMTAPFAGSAGWRIQERIKTVAVGLVLCLHLGVDPPDVLKTQPCAKLECWFDPTSSNATSTGETADANGRAQKPLDTIGRNLVAQYEFWQPRARYKLLGDPTVEEVRKLAQSLRKSAKDERALVHWNGHGTPRPTKAGEIWVFNRQFTQYIPLSVADVVGWLGLPCTFVIDSSGAGHVYDALLSCVPQACLAQNSEGRYMIVLAACQSSEILPMSPDLPADLFTACLTTPLEIAVRWHVLQSGSLTCPKAKKGVEALMGLMPGRLNDRKTVLGELHWIFTAITDTIAWLLFPRDTFKALFRQDLMTASLFRNFLLAQRIMRPYQCTPMSWPPVPPGSVTHKLWLVWDHVLDETLGKVHAAATGQFFAEQMDAFEAWLDQTQTEDDLRPEHLPIVLQVLLSQSHRARALSLLVRFIDLGPAMTKDALDVGILPYILKLLQSPCSEIRHALLSVWTRILAYDGSTQKDLAKDDAYLYFVKCLPPDGTEESEDSDGTMATMCLAVFWHLSPAPAKHEALLTRLFECACLRLYKPSNGSDDHLLWTVNCMAALWEENAEAKVNLAKETHRDLMDRIIVPLTKHRDWRLRAAACYLAGTFLCPDSLDLPSILLELEQDMLLHLSSSLLLDASEETRTELTVCLSKFVFKHFNKFALAAYDIWEAASQGEDKDRTLVPVASGDLVRNPSTYSILWESVLALSLDPSDTIARLASSLVDEIHMSFLFMGVASSITKEVLFVQQEEVRRSPSPTSAQQQPLPARNKFVLTSALPLVSDFIPSCHLQFISTQKAVMRERLDQEHGMDPSAVHEQSVLQRHLGECQSSQDARFDRQLALLAHGALPTRLAFHPYLDRLVVADSRNRLSVWDWSANVKGSVFVNGNPERLSHISGLLSIPNDRLLVASTDGIVRCWHPDYEGSGLHKPADLVGVCQMVANVGTGSPIFEIDHVGSTCYAVANSDTKPRQLYGWDLDQSNGLAICPLGVDASPTSIRASRHEHGLVFVGFSSGLLSQYDLRTTSRGPVTFQAHEAWLVDLVESPSNPHHLISASVLGDLCIFDRRNPGAMMMRYDLLGGTSGLLTFAGHEVMSTLAVGSTDQALRFLSPGKLLSSSDATGVSTTGFSLHTVKYHEGLFGQRIGSPATAAFHPNRPIYAAASTDMVIALYGTSPGVASTFSTAND